MLFISNIGFFCQIGANHMEGKNIQKPATLVLVFILASLTILPSVITATNTPEAFSIIWITDTQYLSERHPTYYHNLCHWIVENKDTYNVKMVVHTGDIVNDAGNCSQWLNANQSMGILLDNGIPYCWDAGNHDYNATYWIGNQFVAFNPQEIQTKSYWVSDDFNGANTAVHFNVSGWDCLIVNIAFEANDSVLTWANNLLDANPQSHVVMATHAYLTKEGTYDSWASRFKSTVLDTHPNVFLTLSGHYHPVAGNRIRVGDRDELLFNQQDASDQVGAESARILTFDIAKGTINVQTCDLYLNQFIEDSNNNFTLNTSFNNDFVANNVIGYLFAVVLVGVLVSIVCICFLLRRRKQNRSLDNDSKQTLWTQGN